VVTMSTSHVTAIPGSDVKTLDWFSLQVRANRTLDIAKALTYKGYEAFTPSNSIKRRWCDRTRVVEYPIFPGYVFAKVDLRHRLPILTTPGVYGIVGLGREPVPIAAEEIANLQRALQSGLTVGPWPFLRCGDRVRIEVGSIAGFTGILVDNRKPYRVVVSVELIQRSISVEVDRDAVRVMKSAESMRFQAAKHSVNVA
jgi:transcription antitermination factor NusG